MFIKSFTKLAVLGVIGLAAGVAAAQDGQKMRSITSDDFKTARPLSKKAGPRKVKAVIYKFVRLDKKQTLARKPTANHISSPIKPGKEPKPAINRPIKITEIGLTMWKMRPPRSSERGLVLLPVDDRGTEKNWLPERVDPDSVFKSGDMIRFAIESSKAGYRYIVDRETFADGSLGAPCLIFPESEGDDNSVYPGMLFDIPDQRGNPPYFTFKPFPDCIDKPRIAGGPDYMGELMTVIISSQPLSVFKLDRHGKIQNSDVLAEIEDGAEIEIFSRTDSADRIYSKEEADSACGSLRRGIVREKSPGDPCGTNSRKLTRDEAQPQSIYRAKSPADQPTVAFVRLTVQP